MPDPEIAEKLPCPVCKGLGELPEARQGWDVGEPAPKCHVCGGFGWLASRETWEKFAKITRK
jgi:hypothetical protein